MELKLQAFTIKHDVVNIQPTSYVPTMSLSLNLQNAICLGNSTLRMRSGVTCDFRVNARIRSDRFTSPFARQQWIDLFGKSQLLNQLTEISMLVKQCCYGEFDDLNTTNNVILPTERVYLQLKLKSTGVDINFTT